MIKVSVMYPAGEGNTFDMEYYLGNHVEIVNRDMGPSKVEIDKQVDGPYLVICHLYYDSMEAMKAGMDNAADALADIPNFTNSRPVVQTSEIVG